MTRLHRELAQAFRKTFGRAPEVIARAPGRVEFIGNHTDYNGGTVLGINPAANDIGLISLKDKRTYAAAVFVSGTTLDEPARDRLIGDVARLMAASLG